MQKALLVGINDYPGTANDLAGCVNDTAILKDLLVSGFGFAAADVVVLANVKATRDAILDTLGNLVAKAAAGDTIVFQFSGHGTQVPDEDDDETVDHLDEALCPRDFSWDGVWIRDDDLSEVFSRLPKDVHLEVLLDACHSGTGTREIALGPVARSPAGLAAALGAAWRPRTARRRFLVPPRSLEVRLADARGRGLRPAKVGALARAKPRGLNHVLWAACRPDQYAADAEFGGRANGAFTWFFCDAAQAGGRDGRRAQLLEMVRKGLKKDGYEQSPQLECVQKLRDGRLFED